MPQRHYVTSELKLRAVNLTAVSKTLYDKQHFNSHSSAASPLATNTSDHHTQIYTFCPQAAWHTMYPPASQAEFSNLWYQNQALNTFQRWNETLVSTGHTDVFSTTSHQYWSVDQGDPDLHSLSRMHVLLQLYK